MRIFLRILGFARPIGLLLPQYVAFILLATVFSVVNFTILIPLLEVLFNQVEPDSFRELPPFSFSIDYFTTLFYHHFGAIIAEQGKMAALYFVCGIIVLSVFLSNLFRYLSSLILAKVRVNVIRNLRNRAFFSLAHFDLSYFTGKKKGDIISRVTTDVQEVEASVVSTLRVLFKEPLLMIGYFIAMFRMSVELSLYTLILVPLSGTVISLIAKKLRRRARKSQETLGRINSVLDESISGMRIIKAFTATGYVKDRFAGEVRTFSRHNYRLAARVNLAGPVAEFLGVFVLSLVLIVGGQMVLANESPLSASEFIGFLVIFSQVLNPAKAISGSLNNIHRGIASGERIFQLIDSKPEIVEGSQEISELKEGIEFRQVSFAYTDRQVLKNISFPVRKGETVALVGPSGGGKSTIADLIPRFYDPSAGQILLDGIPLSEFKLDSLRNLMGIVAQESILFNDTIANNIAFGKADATLEQIMEAARAANAHEFIEKLEKGYDTPLGERGARLSGGQQQRISIARALLKNPEILILDEATSALDSQSEKLVQDALKHLMKGCTSIVIAHRLSTIQDADRILVVKEGEIVESGTHEELMERGGLYKDLTRMQSV